MKSSVYNEIKDYLKTEIEKSLTYLNDDMDYMSCSQFNRELNRLLDLRNALQEFEETVFKVEEDY